MRNHAILQLILFLCSIVSYAQNTDCNRAVWIKEDEKKLPNGICIPKEYLISNIYESTDVNNDGLMDFIFKWRKSELQDGDTMYVTIYVQNSDSTFSFFRTFNNLYPIYFKSYSRDYIPKDEKLRSVHKKYRGEYLLLKLKFEKNIIEITIMGDATTDLIITYKYDRDIKNWRYDNTVMYDFVANTKELYDLSEEVGPTIDNFTYFIWDVSAL